ncbi:MAG: hypothetical protein D6831_00735 [Aquificota bacterium]|nr:MAG: hypothetical protein D6831_00735 [Aquificota bacterium]
MTDYLISFLIGFLTGVLYFYHLYKSIKKSVENRKNKLSFWVRFGFFSVIATLTAYFFHEGIIFFLIGFYLARIFFSKIIL